MAQILKIIGDKDKQPLSPPKSVGDENEHLKVSSQPHSERDGQNSFDEKLKPSASALSKAISEASAESARSKKIKKLEFEDE